MARKHTSPFWDDGLKLISFCPLCETHYNPMEAKVVGERGGAHLLHITCKKCSNSVIALVMANREGVSSVGLVTDLSFGDVVRFRESPAVDTDDVLELHGALEDEPRFWKSISA